jgi:hypothetical protein
LRQGNFTLLRKTFVVSRSMFSFQGSQRSPVFEGLYHHSTIKLGLSTLSSVFANSSFLLNGKCIVLDYLLRIQLNRRADRPCCRQLCTGSAGWKPFLSDF